MFLAVSVNFVKTCRLKNKIKIHSAGNVSVLAENSKENKKSNKQKSASHSKLFKQKEAAEKAAKQ